MKWVMLAILLAGIVGAGMVCNGVFREHLLSEAQSISPDGQYRCIVVERGRPGSSRAVVTLAKRDYDKNGRELWKQVEQQKFEYDSISPSHFTIDWEYNQQFRPTTVKVISGGDPEGGNRPGIIFERKLPVDNQL